MRLRALLFAPEVHPTFRPDVAVLFGKYLPRLGVQADLVTVTRSGEDAAPWGGGQVFGPPQSSGRLAKHLQSLANDWRALLRLRSGYELVIVRDKPIFAAFALVAARLAGVPFGYWMSFPMPESHLAFARERGLSIGVVRLAVAYARGFLCSWSLYRFVMPLADIAFLQSDAMVADLQRRGVPMRHPVAVPMGVDHEAADASAEVNDARIEPWLAAMQERPAVVYLGTLERRRRMEIAVQAMDLARRRRPELLMVLIGDSFEPADLVQLKALVESLGLAQHVIFTGWLDTASAWRLVRAARIGLSTVPRGPLHDVASPTKLVEYLAQGLPVVANDQPDQAWVIEQSNGGLCTTHDAPALADAIVRLIEAPEQAVSMGRTGRDWVRRHRGYDSIAAHVAQAMQSLRSA